jgi:hypothetical protein
VTFPQSQVFLRTEPFTPKKKPKKEVDYFLETPNKYDTVFENSTHYGLLSPRVFRFGPAHSRSLLLGGGSFIDNQEMTEGREREMEQGAGVLLNAGEKGQM